MHGLARVDHLVRRRQWTMAAAATSGRRGDAAKPISISASGFILALWSRPLRQCCEFMPTIAPTPFHAWLFHNTIAAIDLVAAMTEAEARSLLGVIATGRGLEGWIAARRWKTAPGGWAVTGELEGWQFRVEAIAAWAADQRSCARRGPGGVGYPRLR